jgi:hypothetical protein
MNYKEYVKIHEPTYVYTGDLYVSKSDYDLYHSSFISDLYIFYKLSDKYLLAIDCPNRADWLDICFGRLNIRSFVGYTNIRIFEIIDDNFINPGQLKIKQEWLVTYSERTYDLLIQEVENFLKSRYPKKENENDTDPKLSVGSKKPSTAAIPPISILLLGLAMKDGEKKYGRFNWRKTKVDNSVYYDAAMRHLLSYWDGEEKAQDSNIQHLAHVMACCAILIDAHYTDSCIDTREPTLVVSSFIDEFYKRNKQNG